MTASDSGFDCLLLFHGRLHTHEGDFHKYGASDAPTDSCRDVYDVTLRAAFFIMR